MSIAFDRFCLVVPFAKPADVVLSACMGVGVWGCPNSSRVVRIGKASLSFRKVALISASAAEDMTVLMIWHMVWMAPLLMGRVVVCCHYRRVGRRGKMASGLATCAFFTEIGRITGNVEDHVSGMIV